MRYHAFNGRLMVYDERGSVIGDAHLTNSSQTLEEHEELALDRGAAIVLVGVRTGESEVDLGELVDKRAREVEKRRREAAEKQQRARPQRPPMGDGGTGAPHRQLSAIMHTPGRIGRAAIPRESPYEQRQQQMRQQQQEQADTPSAKRQKTAESPPSKMGHARHLFGTQLNLSATRPMRSWSQRSQILQDRTNVRKESPPPAEKQRDDDAVILDEQRRPQKRDTHPTPSPTEKPPERPSKEVNTNPDKGGSKILRQTTKSRLGSLRVSRIDREDADESQPLELDIPLQSRKTASARPQTSRPTVITIDSSIDGGEMHTTFTKPNPKISLQAPKEVAASRASDITSKSTTGRGLTREEASQSVPRSKRASPPPGPPAIGRSGITSAGRNKSHASGSGMEPTQGDKRVELASLRDAQPRTELRIKTRKRRGLLMLSEARPPTEEECMSSETAHKESPLLAEAETESFDEWYAKGIVSDGEAHMNDEGHQPSLSPPKKGRSQQDVAETAPIDVEVGDYPSPPPLSASASSADHRSSRTEEETGHAEVTQPRGSPVLKEPTQRANAASDDSSDSDAPRTRRRRKQTKTSARTSDAPPSTIPDCAYDESQSEDDWDGPATAATRSKRTKKKPASKPKAADKKQANKGPRMSRINKNSKSKEIFGLKLPENDHIIPNSWVTSIGRMGWDHATATATAGPSDVGHKVAQEKTQVETVQPPPTTDSNKAAADKAFESSKSTTTARVANPATRGRKAASKADAAGRAPQSVVPFDTPLAPAKPAEPKQVAKEPSSLPGFSKANGGAWSSHAEDLLGMERPKARSSAR